MQLLCVFYFPNLKVKAVYILSQSHKVIFKYLITSLSYLRIYLMHNLHTMKHSIVYTCCYQKAVIEYYVNSLPKSTHSGDVEAITID